jgi:uncharacterized protein YqgV (UPF0045/DUF77 family)
VQLEFLIEPFVEGQPGAHVQAAVAAVEAAGVSVDFGPFGSTCRVPADRLPELVRAITGAALDNGATHLSIQIAPDGTDEPT